MRRWSTMPRLARLKPRTIVAVGFSIGTGIAAQLSAQRKLDGLILVTPFNSLKAVAQAMYPWLPIGPFFNHEIDAADASRAERDAGRDHRGRARRDRSGRAHGCASHALSQTWSSTGLSPRRSQ